MGNRGLFITFEGPDGSGKTTQINKLAAVLKKEETPFILTREPGGTAISDKVRAIILNPKYSELTSKTEILLYAASRSQHVDEKIRPALESGKIVLCDRFIDASIAYQGYGLGQPVDRVRSINRFASGGLTPDRTYLIDISPEAGRRRMIVRGGRSGEGLKNAARGLDRIERRHLAYHRRVREGFLTLYRENKQRIVLINGEREEDAVFQCILQDFRRFFNKHMTYDMKG
ncbi:dTMP kinase [Sporolactobacillus sp. THM7-7]|nr:dTMP kinase [Sporolactobacillus sp. THM7-7]